ncbi:hypothetical protein [Bacillus sp. RO1]|uniref:hypothetical protein n=1 Tax=Bacillus sp. RO1 TaxID=2722703 RepID=UPI0014564FD3|nr:hypothetical protein [Bacillus sp. RO1]NLP52515.1 hypothetical protein [Bacillus sp. RO1]
MGSILRIITIPLVVVHLLIAYFWIFDWEKLVTEVGRISWVGSIIIGIVIVIINRKSMTTDQKVSKRIVAATTFMTILLGIFALMIELITSSMP